MNVISKFSALAGLAVLSLPALAQDNFPNVQDNHWAREGIRVIVNGEAINFGNVQPIETDGRVLVPLRGVFESLGAHVHWTSATQTVNVERRDRRVECQIGNHRAMVDGREVNLDVPPELMADTTMVPLRFISEALGADVDWRSQEMTVVVSTVPREREPRRVAGETIERDIIAPDTRLRIVLDDAIGSRMSQRGDRFAATVVSDEPDWRDAKVYGVVESAGSAIAGAPGVLRIRFTQIRSLMATKWPLPGALFR